MPNLALSFGIVLILLGLAGYLGTGRESFTALIPSFFGILFLVTGILGRKESMRKHAMHAAAAVSLLGFLGTVSGLIKLFSVVGGGEAERSAAVIVQSIMAVICLIFLYLSVRSFINARRKSKESA